MWRRSAQRVRASVALAVTAILLASMGGPAANAHNLYNWSPSYWTLSRSTTTWRTAQDSFYMNAQMQWNAAHASDMVHMATHGYRFTHDVQDTGQDNNQNNNVNATGRYATQLPSPYYDRDESGSCFRHPEGEITSESSTFPVSGRSYASQIEFSHWYCLTGSMGTVWYWDSSGDEMTETAQISERGCPLICDKWDAAQGLADKEMGYPDYPSKSAPAGALAAIEDAPEEGAVTARGSTSAEPAYGAQRDDATGEVTLVADLSEGLDSYREKAAKAAVESVRSGRSRGVLTFARPVTMAEVGALEAQGVLFETIEAVSTDRRGARWTVGGPRDTATEAWISAEIEQHGESLLGIVSAGVVVDEAALRSANASKTVYLVDLSIEDYGRGHRSDRDIVMNDLYWKLAGWD